MTLLSNKRSNYLNTLHYHYDYTTRLETINCELECSMGFMS
jgi:hypothetical protein